MSVIIASIQQCTRDIKERKEANLLFFKNDVIIYIENLKVTVKYLLELISEFSRLPNTRSNARVSCIST
jgi:hypothetical protein